jgi:alpha-D-xyloside xylohydrolase
VVQGPGWRREEHGFLSLPLLVRPNTVLPVGSRSDRPDYDFNDGVILKVFQFEDGRQTRVEIPNPTGDIETTFEVQRAGDAIQIRREGPPKAWKILFVNTPSIETDHPSEQTSEGSLVSLDESTNLVEITILPE